MFPYNKRDNITSSKGKSNSISPIHSILYPNSQESIINNFNVKVNITKKKTKNISIANLTLNNPSFLKGKELYNLRLNSNSNNNNNKYDNYLRKSENISPKSSQSPDQELKNANTVLNSPKHCYKKIISKMKTEFQEIACRTNSKKETNPNEESSMNASHNNINGTSGNEEENQRVNKVNIQKSKGNRREMSANGKGDDTRPGIGISIIEKKKKKKISNKRQEDSKQVLLQQLQQQQQQHQQHQQQHQHQQQELNLLNKRLNINTISSGSNDINDMTSYITSHKCLMKPHLTNNYSRKNNILKINPIHNTINNHPQIITEDHDHNHTTINPSDITINLNPHPNYNSSHSFVNLYQSKQSSFTLLQDYSTYQLNANLLAMNNDLSSEKESHNKTSQSLQDSLLTINFLQEYIKTQQDVYIRESNKYRNTHVFNAAYNDIVKQQTIIDELAKENIQIKNVVFKLLYFIECDYLNASKAYSNIEMTVAQLLKENTYLRRLSLIINPIPIRLMINQGGDVFEKATTAICNNYSGIVKNNHKRQDTQQIIYSSENDYNMKTDSSNFDILSHTMKEYKSLEKTMKKDFGNQSHNLYLNPSGSIKHLNICDMKRKIIPIKRELCYRRKEERK